MALKFLGFWPNNGLTLLQAWRKKNFQKHPDFYFRICGDTLAVGHGVSYAGVSDNSMSPDALAEAR